MKYLRSLSRLTADQAARGSARGRAPRSISGGEGEE